MALMRGVFLLLAALALAVPVELPGCGWMPPKALFALASQPEKPVQEFARGELGVVQPGYERTYLVIAYRYLSGVGLNEREREALFAPGETTGDAEAWTTVRAGLPFPAGPAIDPYRTVTANGYMETVLNCSPDAFHTAALTLRDRSRQFGPSSPLLREWVQAQDVVFSNCGGGEAIPGPAADARLRADREYQIAAAKFYARRFDEARADFERIAEDAGSPWRASGPYLAARCLIRGEKLAEAEARLEKIMADPSQPEWQERARRLRNYVVLKSHPAERLHELAQAIERANAEKTIRQDLIDYNRIAGSAARPFADDITDWIATFQTSNRDHALEQWHATRSLPWLVAALRLVRPGDTEAPPLLEAAREVPPSSPAYATVSYHALRLLPRTDARRQADRMLRMKLPVSAHNLFLGERMRLARDLNEFLRYAPRKPVGVSDFDGEFAQDEARLYLDDDSTAVLNSGVPLSVLKQVAESTLLPANVRQELRHVVFARSLLFAASPDFDGVLTLLRSPGIGPWVRPGFGRRSYYYSKGFEARDNVPSRLDNFRDNWWRPVREPAVAAVPAFLSEADRKAAEREWRKLRDLPHGANWLGAQTLAFAASHPDDPRVPEALHRVVRAVRFSVTDEHTAGFAYQAFSLLHRKYGQTEWARKTPYWYR